MEKEELLKYMGERIKSARIRCGYSQEFLAKKIGYASRSSIAKIESGERDITRDKVVLLAAALGVTPSYLMGWSDDDENYYHDPEAAALADMIKDNPRYRVLFEASRDLSKENIDFVIKMIENLPKGDEDFSE